MEVQVDITSTASPAPSVVLSTSLWNNPAEGVPSLLVENGGTCHYSPRPNPPCAEGFTPCGSTCVNLLADAFNCGRCGNVCVNSSCTGGYCFDIH